MQALYLGITTTSKDNMIMYIPIASLKGQKQKYLTLRNIHSISVDANWNIPPDISARHRVLVQ